MTEETRVTNDVTGGQKGSKAQRVDLIPSLALEKIGEVYDFGSRKYEPNNWLKGYAWSLSVAALLRHILAFNRGEDLDEESGLPHLAHAGFHIMALLVFSQSGRYNDLDDRPVLRDTPEWTFTRVFREEMEGAKYEEDREMEALVAEIRGASEPTVAVNPTVEPEVWVRLGDLRHVPTQALYDELQHRMQGATWDEQEY